MTSDDTLVLAGEFPPVSHDDWLAAVDKVLKGRAFADVLQTVTSDGIVIEPLYTLQQQSPVEQYPGPGTGRRASTPWGSLEGWDIRQRHELGASTADTNQAVLTDLQRGVTSIELVTAGLGDEAAFDAVLQGVHLDLAPVALRSIGDGVREARLLLALAASRGVAPSSLTADLGCDPISTLIVTGGIDVSVDDALQNIASLAVEVSRSHPATRTLRADGGVVAEAGASPATELAATAAAGVAYLRALDHAGLGAEAALSQVLLSVTVGTDQFGDMAKLRALRVLWSRVAEVMGVPAHRATVQAVTADLVLSQCDPWVNMLRTTLGCFAAAAGGADIVTVTPFDAQIGVPDELGLRVARNTQLALMEESNLHRVMDPAGGSWYVERLTDQLAAEAWGAFQDIEAEGGIVASLQAGELQRRVDHQWEAQRLAVATRSRPITGVSEFPDLDEEQLPRPAHPTASQPDAQPVVRSLPQRRLTGEFEELRHLARAAQPTPVVFLANLGPVAVHTARASWAKNFFESGGIRAIGNDGFDTDEALAEACHASGARLAVLCSSDSVYADRATAAVGALRHAGVERVYLAGNPGGQRGRYEAAGVDEFVHVGVDAVDVLRRAHDALSDGRGVGGDA